MPVYICFGRQHRLKALHCIENKVLIRPLGNIVYIVPPTVITNEELQKVYKVLLSLLDYLKKESFL